MKKTICSLTLQAVNKRYLKFLSEVETPEVGVDKLNRLTHTQHDENGHRYKGFYLLAEEAASFFRRLIRGDFVISGFSNKDLGCHLPEKNAGQIPRLLRRLKEHGLIKRVGLRYRDYLTDFGRQVLLMALKLRELVIIPSLAFETAEFPCSLSKDLILKVLTRPSLDLSCATGSLDQPGTNFIACQISIGPSVTKFPKNHPIRDFTGRHETRARIWLKSDVRSEGSDRPEFTDFQRN